MSTVLLSAAQAALGELGGAGINPRVLVASAHFQRGRRPLGWTMAPNVQIYTPLDRWNWW